MAEMVPRVLDPPGIHASGPLPSGEDTGNHGSLEDVAVFEGTHNSTSAQSHQCWPRDQA